MREEIKGPLRSGPDPILGRSPHGEGHQSWDLRDQSQELSRHRGRSVRRGKEASGNVSNMCKGPKGGEK